jgi:hypothetical protein
MNSGQAAICRMEVGFLVPEARQIAACPELCARGL